MLVWLLAGHHTSRSAASSMMVERSTTSSASLEDATQPPPHKMIDKSIGKRRGKQELTLQLDLINNEEDTKPQDAAEDTSSVGFWITYAAFLFSGAANVGMWSSITLCLDFFVLKYPTERVGFVFPVVNMSTLLVVCLYMVVAGRQLPLEPRVHGSLAVYLFFVVFLPIVNIVELHEPVAYGLTIFAVVGSTIVSSIQQSTMYGLAGVFGPYFIQAIDGGKGFAALVLFVVRLYSKWYFQLPANPQSLVDPAEIAAFHRNAKISMAAFFSITFVLVALCWVLYVALKHTTYAQPMIREYLLVQHETPFAASPVYSPLRSATNRSLSPSKRTTEQSPLLPRTGASPNLEEYELRASHSPSSVPPVSPDRQALLDHAASATILNVLRTAAKPFFSLFLVFFICLSCFPGLVTAIPSVSYGLGDWFPIILVGCYNLGDLIGKNLPVYILYFDVASLHLPWLLQIAFLPLFMIDFLDPFHDLCSIVLVVCFGFLTGYVSTCSMILAPSVCSEYQKEVAGMVGSLCAIVGLCAGSYNGLALETILRFLKVS